jgi:L-asparaginase II
MHGFPEMVAGTDRFDTDLLRQAAPRLICKGGAEGYYCLGLPPDIQAGRPLGLGLALKIADGDQSGRARPVAAIQALRLMGILSSQDETALAKYGRPEVRNHRGDVVGQVRPAFALE